MLPIKRLVQISILCLVIISGTLLGLSLGDHQIVAIVVIGSTAGFLLVDHYRLFKIDGILANMASIIILILAMKDFLPEDSTGKLLSVANLLVYLQTVLMFQEKTPRLVWQIMVLSLLHVVVAAIFSLNFEGGMLFLLYFFVAAIALLFQGIYVGNWETVRRNQFSVARLDKVIPNLALEGSPVSAGLAERRTIRREDPIVFFDVEPRNYRPLRMMLMHLAMWMGIAFAFTMIMFYLTPRHAKPWFGPGKTEVATTGFNRSVELYNDSVVLQSDKLIFRVAHEGYGEQNGESVAVSQECYYRGMALSSLVIEDGKTNWRAPQDRIQDEHYQSLLSFRGKGKPIKQIITLEETTDPLIYSSMPTFRDRETSKDIEFCHEVSALTRCHLLERINKAPYQYMLGTIVDANGAFAKAWPYIPNSPRYAQYSMDQDLPQRKWLTEIDESRYPELVRIAQSVADQVKEQNPDAGRIELIRALESYFLEPNRFNYTVDFREVPWDEGLDPVEDFVRNHRTGHCQLFASALTLMLRSQDIPARLVVGFYGGDYNRLSDSIMVRGKHAHAWVETYLRPEDCTSQMREKGEAGPGGAWLLVDSTPPTDLSGVDVGSDAMDLARSMWQDYVLGMDTAAATQNETAGLALPIFEIIQNWDVENMERKFAQLKRSSRSPAFRVGIGAVVLLPFLIPWLISLFYKSKPSEDAEPGKRSALRRFVAGAISLISPTLGNWVMEAGRDHHHSTAFYDRMAKMLKPLGLTRNSAQTHREFARQVANRFDEHPAASLIGSTVREITELFNDVRFGKQTLPPDLLEQIDFSLNELETTLKTEFAVVENRTSVSPQPK